MTSFVVIVGSLSFWLKRGDMITENLINIMIMSSTYPDTIFKEALLLQ